MLDRFQNAQWYIGGDPLSVTIYDASRLDRFKDVQWHIGGDPLSATIYDASDPDGPDGHGVVCQGAVIEDARLIAASPDLLAAAKALLQRGPVGIESECHWCGREGEDTEDCSNDDCMGTLARAAIAKAEWRA